MDGIEVVAERADAEGGWLRITIDPAAFAGPPVPRDVFFVVETRDPTARVGRAALPLAVRELGPEDRFEVLDPAGTPLFGALVAADATTIAAVEDWTQQSHPPAPGLMEAAVQRPGRSGALRVIVPIVHLADLSDARDRLLTALGDGRLFPMVTWWWDGAYTGLADCPGLVPFTAWARGALVAHRSDQPIEPSVRRLLDAFAAPVLVDLTIEPVGLRIFDPYPERPPDVFAGRSWTWIARYEGSGPQALVLGFEQAGVRREVGLTVDLDATGHPEVGARWRDVHRERILATHDSWLRAAMLGDPPPPLEPRTELAHRLRCGLTVQLGPPVARMGATAPRLDRAHEECGVGRDPRPFTLRAMVVVAPDGTIDEVRTLQSDLGDPALEACLLAHATSAPFPTGSDRTTTWALGCAR